MLLSDKLVLKLLSLTPEQTADLTKEQEKTGKSFQQLALSKNLVSERELTKRYGDYIGVPFVTVEKKDIPDKALKLIPEPVARQYRAIIFKIDDNGLIHLALNDPDDIQAVNFLQKELGARLKIYVATNQNILDCLELYRGDVTEELTHVIDIQKEEHKSQEVREEDISEDSPIAQTVNLLLEYAIKSNASDIHIETGKTGTTVRFRLDGFLVPMQTVQAAVGRALAARLKVLAHLNVLEQRRPQDGRIELRTAHLTLDVRISIVPAALGESVVLRILPDTMLPLSLQELGFSDKQIRLTEPFLRLPSGLILITGPTGSGKTTTLSAFLHILNKPDVKIISIEDPVEYRIDGVTQIQTNDELGLSFDVLLKRIFRQDPDIIMIGEIRDAKTAELAARAALTGHLVFSTLHTDNAVESVMRLEDLGVYVLLLIQSIVILLLTYYGNLC